MFNHKVNIKFLGAQRANKLDDTIYVLLNISKGAETRRRILKALQCGPKNCNQIARQIGVDWWTIQKHLQLLIKTGLINEINIGRMKYYKLNMVAKV
jgi:predicted transcriptional regulator